MAVIKKGAIKIAARKAGLSVPEYTNRIANDLKKCTICKQWKNKNDAFLKDKSRHDGISPRCIICSKAIWRRRSMMSKISKKRIVRRDGDKIQARARINSDIEMGFRPNPNDLYCSLCGHKGGDRRHEYHHILGYEKEHHYDVLPLCSKCHGKERKK